MPILQKIQEAEQAAANIKQNAQKEVELFLEETRKQAQVKAAQVLAEAKETVKANNLKTLDLINKLEKENLDNIEKEKEELHKQAIQNSEVGVNYIIRQVVEI